MPTATAHCAAQLLGSRARVLESCWDEVTPRVLLDLLRGVRRFDGLSEIEMAPRHNVLKARDEDPLFAAASYLIEQGGPESAPDTARISRSVLPAELIELFHGTSRRGTIDARWQTLPNCCADAKVADGHVHSGGASPPIVLLRALLRHMTEIPAGGLGLKVKDSEGSLFDIEPLVLAIGISALALEAGERFSSDLAVALPQLGLTGEEVWETAVAATTTASGPVEDLRRGYNLLTQRAGAPNLTAVVAGVTSWLKRDAQPATAALARGCLAGLTLLHSALVSPASSSLDVFVERFNLMRSVRKLGDQVEIDRIEDSIRFLTSGGRLERLELRKTTGSGVSDAAGGSRRDTYADLHEDVRRHALAAQRVSLNHPELIVQMPVSFLRYPPPIAGGQLDGQITVALRHPLMGALGVGNGVARACAASEETRDFIGSLDVVGRESDSPNWIFSLAFEYVDRALRHVGCMPLGYSLHAGEQFTFPLDGLRRIGEVLLFSTNVTRIGHGLALSSRVAATTVSGKRLLCSQMLEALLWASWMDCDLDADVAADCELLGATVFAPLVPTFYELLEWFECRFDYDRLAKIGLLPDPHLFKADLIAADEALPRRSIVVSGRVDRMLVASILVPPFEDAGFNETTLVPAYMSDRVTDLAQRCYDKCVEPLRAEFEARRLIESCPSSNVSTAALDGFGQHPIGEFKRRGLRATVSSDDPGLFGALVEEEILSLHESGALGADGEAEDALTEIIAESMSHTAPGLTTSRLDEILVALARE